MLYGLAQCSDQRDRVYSLLGLSSDCANQNGLDADYSLTKEELFLTVSCFCKPDVREIELQLNQLAATKFDYRIGTSNIALICDGPPLAEVECHILGFARQHYPDAHWETFDPRHESRTRTECNRETWKKHLLHAGPLMIAATSLEFCTSLNADLGLVPPERARDLGIALICTVLQREVASMSKQDKNHRSRLDLRTNGFGLSLSWVRDPRLSVAFSIRNPTGADVRNFDTDSQDR